MEKRFAIKSEHFSLYQAFRKEAEKIGWHYNEEFNLFEESRMRSCDCLFFSTAWGHKEWDPKFSFSNSGQNVFKIPEQWSEAIEHIRNVLEAGRPEEQAKAKMSVSLKDLAALHGVSVEDIVITA